MVNTLFSSNVRMRKKHGACVVQSLGVHLVAVRTRSMHFSGLAAEIRSCTRVYSRTLALSHSRVKPISAVAVGPSIPASGSTFVENLGILRVTQVAKFCVDTSGLRGSMFIK
jgi:hypothetical protein